MRVLFVCHRLPYPPARGGKIRPFNIIKHLTESGHQVTVASLARSRLEAEDGRDLQKHCAECLIEQIGSPRAVLQMVARLPSPTPSSMGYFYSPRLRRAVVRALSRASFDLIAVHCSSVADYVADVQGIPKILDFGDMDSQKWLLYAGYKPFPLSAGYWLEGRKLEHAEKRLTQRFDLCTCTTRAELETLNGFETGVPTDWFPNGVDASYFQPKGDGYDPDSICFVGRMDYFPNQQAVMGFCRDVLPLIRARRPTARFSVAGAAPPAPIKELAKQDGIVVTGTVRDVRPHVQNAALTIAPLVIARGTQNKILESMAMGVPVVASVVAAKGVDADVGRDILAADEPRDFAEAVLELLDRREVRRRFAEAARARVLSHHSWPASMQRFDGIVARCLGSAAHPP